MDLFSWFHPKKEETEKVEKPISIDTYVVEERYGLKNPLIIVGFPGGGHEERVVTRREISIRYYLERMLIKKRIGTEKKSTGDLNSEKRDFRGNGELDRSYHNGSQFHFYEGNSNGQLEEAIKGLEGEYGLTPNRELPDFLDSDLARLV